MPDILLRELAFSSYKRFASEETIKIKPITLLVGKNSSGKSSITKLLPLLNLSLDLKVKDTPMLFDDNGISLGVSYSDIAHNGDPVSLAFTLSFDEGISIGVTLMSDRFENVTILKYELIVGDKKRVLKLTEDRNSYLCEENGKLYSRDSFIGFIHTELFKELKVTPNLYQSVDYLGPYRFLPKRQMYFKIGENLDTVSPDGERAYSILYKDESILKEVSKWFENSFNGCKVQVNTGGEKNAYKIEFQKKDNKDHWVNIVDEGQGMAQVLPIVVRCNKSVPGSIVIIEQPELHLHPAAHAELAYLFSSTAKTNNQRYIVETHSENILLGIRDAIVDKDRKLNADDVIVYFVDEDENGSYLREITIDEYGVLSEWPDGVFNEAFKLLCNIKEKSNKI